MKMFEMLTLLIGMCIGLVIGAIVVAIDSPVNDMKRQAIERGYGLYCPHNGEFAWVGECE